jgi:hypothetical protein
LLPAGQNATRLRREIVTVFALHSINGTGKLRLKFRKQFVELDRIMKAPNHGKQLSSQVLKERYLQCFGVRANNVALLQGVVKDLLDGGVPRKTLVAWAVEAGYSKGYVSGLLSRILVSVGLRERRKGAGRKPSPATLELLAHARSRYGKDFLKVLRAAWRTGKAQLGATSASSETSPRGSSAFVASQFQKPGTNYGAIIKRGTRPARQSKGTRFRSTTITFRKTCKSTQGISSKNRGTL